MAENDERYRLKYIKKALKQLKKIDSGKAKMLVTKIHNDLHNSSKPHTLPNAKAMSGQYQGAYRFRYGKYRVITEIRHDELVVIALEIATRQSIYR